MRTDKARPRPKIILDNDNDADILAYFLEYGGNKAARSRILYDCTAYLKKNGSNIPWEPNQQPPGSSSGVTILRISISKSLYPEVYELYTGLPPLLRTGMLKSLIRLCADKDMNGIHQDPVDSDPTPETEKEEIEDEDEDEDEDDDFGEFEEDILSPYDDALPVVTSTDINTGVDSTTEDSCKPSTEDDDTSDDDWDVYDFLQNINKGF